MLNLLVGTQMSYRQTQKNTQQSIDPNLDLERIRLECLELVQKRAYVSAGVATIPIPFLDVVVDVGILSQLIPEINYRFGLSDDRLTVYDPKTKTIHWKELAKWGFEISSLVATRTTIKSSVQGFFTKIMTKQVSKFVPFGGQMVSAGLGYVIMKKIAVAHVEESYHTAKKLQQQAKQQAQTVNS